MSEKEQKRRLVRLAVQQIIGEEREEMNLKWPAPDYDLAAERKRVASA